MNLHGLVSGYVAVVNPLISVTLNRSTGYTTGADGSRAPSYAAPETIIVQMQALTTAETQHLEKMNISGTLSKVWLNGFVLSLDRDSENGGDLITLADGTIWLVMASLEKWPDWCSVAVQKQSSYATPVPDPTITSFVADPATISSGASVLTPIFAGGTGTVPGVGSVVSGMGYTVSPSATTIYTLTVTNSVGVLVSTSCVVVISSDTPSTYAWDCPDHYIAYVRGDANAVWLPITITGLPVGSTPSIVYTISANAVGAEDQQGVAEITDFVDFRSIGLIGTQSDFITCSAQAIQLYVNAYQVMHVETVLTLTAEITIDEVVVATLSQTTALIFELLQ